MGEKILDRGKHGVDPIFWNLLAGEGVAHLGSIHRPGAIGIEDLTVEERLA